MRWFVILLIGCAGSTPDPTDAPPPQIPACPVLGATRNEGPVPSPPASEVSGLAVSGDTVWVHNDSGEGPQIYAIGLDGTLQATWTLDGVDAIDFEDIARGPGPDGEPWLYVGDIGDNNADRSSVTVYRFPEPSTTTDGHLTPERIILNYPTGPTDAETVMIDPSDGTLWIATKAFDGMTRLFYVRNPTPGPHVLDVGTELQFGTPPLGQATLVTGGDIGPRGAVLRTYLTTAFVWPMAPNEGLLSALEREPCEIQLAPEGQGEAIGWGGDRIITISEGENPVIHVHPFE